MDKEQLDSLPTVTVGPEKIPPPPHSHYAPSEVYSSSESPPAYSRPTMKSSAVQIARIIAMTLITISIIIGSFMLASAWLQARASCTPESSVITQSQINTQSEELFKHLQPEALVQESTENKDNFQNSETDSVSITKKISLDTKISKDDKENKDILKASNNNSNDNDNDDNYNDLDFSGVHIKFPLQLDLDDLASTLMRQSRGLVSCVVERRRSDDYSDEKNDQLDNNNNRPHDQKLSGERVVILCESGETKREEQQPQQEMLTPIIVPLGNVPIPMRPQEQEYHRYQVQNQFPIPDVHHPSFINAQRMNPLDIQNNFLPEIRNIHQIIEMDSNRGLPPVNHPQMELRPIPIELRPVSIEMIQGMRPPSNQMEQQNPSPMLYQDTAKSIYPQDQQPQGIVSSPLSIASNVQENLNSKMGPQVMIHQQFKQKTLPTQESQEKPEFPFPGLPIDILKIIKQVPLKIQSIMQRIDEGLKSEQAGSGIRQEQVQDFKPFPFDIRPIPMNPSNIPIEVKNLLEHGNIDGPEQNRFGMQLSQTRPISMIEKIEEKSEEDKKMALPEKNILQRIFENQQAQIMPKSQITMSFIRPIDSFDIPIGVNTQVVDASIEQEEKEPIPMEQNPNQEIQTDKSDDSNRPHYVQPRSVDSNYPSTHLRQERIR